MAFEHAKAAGTTPPKDRPVAVREYLEKAGLLTEKERQVVQHAYGLLSETGSHPHIEEREGALFSRSLVVLLAQYVLLKYEDTRKPATWNREAAGCAEVLGEGAGRLIFARHPAR